MNNGDKDVTQGLIPVYAELGDEPRHFIGYGEFEKDTGLLRFTVDTELAGSSLARVLDAGMASFSIQSLTETNQKEDNK